MTRPADPDPIADRIAMVHAELGPRPAEPYGDGVRPHWMASTRQAVRVVAVDSVRILTAGAVATGVLWLAVWLIR